MLGAIAGDIIGSIHEFGPPAPPGTPLVDPRSHYTDDTLLTLATMEALLEGADYASVYRRAWEAEPNQSWGARFQQWAREPGAAPYNSFGNGSAMRVSPIALWFQDRQQALEAAAASAAVTHDHPEGIKGAQATVDAIQQARDGRTGDAILAAVCERYGYETTPSLDALRASSRYNETCQGTVPPAIQVACQSASFEACMSTCLTLDADTDTLACIAGGVAEARFGVPDWAVELVQTRLGHEQWALVQRFYQEG
ncbi:ADP-ribosylglycohydrolase family protein [Halorhodospira halophila]|uniref:ADP-ribosylation/Crystallin J1 n=1 Tax=Halorhodospira halophila (strain DSM 244 / SL1) TaxID=349124 RepID=A1WU50_HALHL|nr:ADP-ribosylglycohydrolase family protein [Halorhodospira halophila]ABM61212.1 ADP-ribosylation/Crystallin J1 [Halorhodospira halophila SL1]